MTDRVKRYLDFHRNRTYRKKRITVEYPPLSDNKFLRTSECLKYITDAETPIFYPGDIFGFNRTVKNICGDLHSMNNFTPDYEWAIGKGFDDITDELEKRKEAARKDRKDFFQGAINSIRYACAFADRYREYAKEQGNESLYEALSVVPRKKADSYYQALVFMKIIIYVFRSTHAMHITLGRFDKYMFPYYQKSKSDGLSKEELFELTELFFISLNIDTDLYGGVQQGDNGQSLVLGGRTESCPDIYNELSESILNASKELCLIDPKINLRVDKNTPFERYILGTELTRKGLGFPQYCNDDVVIPGLVKLGYDYEDACDYAVAACWEFIIPGVSYEISNIVTMNFPRAVREATMESLENSGSYSDFFNAVKKSVARQFDELKIFAASQRKKFHADSANPFGSLFIKGCRESGVDYAENGAKYNNDGVHGLGVAPAVDAIAAIKELVFDKKSVTKERLLSALQSDFKDDEELRKILLSCPKMGNNDDLTNSISDELLDFYAITVDNVPNSVGGVFRAGTGGSMDYIYFAKDVGATADGRHAGQPYPSSFSPSIGAKIDGPLSVVQSFSRFDMTRIINGGPLTVELHDNVFRNKDGIEKVAQLVRCFILSGGHEFQLNSVSREKLLDAQAHPEKYPDLIVRVWGWSGYFNELDLCFQNHVISRTEYII